MNNKNYIVLARKYRPQTFADLIGQDVLVRTLTNAIKSSKIAQSYILTGIRGIGKTTSARIIAKALNCVGVDGKGSETPNPCGVCEHCRAIAEDRHVDVQEIDAASNTGVDNVREIIDGTRYNPASARYKIYIIDEVHMLSKNAFNALLKTLEEPPEKVKFIFATTEIRKVPVTVLSRCQRFDLQRIDEEMLANHFINITKQESVEIEDEAVKIIARLADGSVRDGLSLLDQAIAQSEGKVTTIDVRNMVGISSKETLISIYESLLQGNIGKVLEDFKSMYNQGYDPITIVQDLLHLTHIFTKIKLNAIKADEVDLSDDEKIKIENIVKNIEMPIFTMFWQMLLKGIDEMRIAPSSLQVAEMLLVRICYFQGVPPTPDMGDRVVKPSEKKEQDLKPTLVGVNSSSVPQAVIEDKNTLIQNNKKLVQETETKITNNITVTFASINELSDYAIKKNEMELATKIRNDIKVVNFKDGLIDIVPMPSMVDNFPYMLSKKLVEWTNKRWVINTVAGGENIKTIKEQEVQEKNDFDDKVIKSDLISKVLTSFPDAKIIKISKQDDEQQYEKEITDEYDGNDEAGAELAEKA